MLEFWPEYNAGPLWSESGESIDLNKLRLRSELRQRLIAWNARYDDSGLPYQNCDESWLGEGRQLLAEIRHALGPSVQVVVTEPWWGEEPRT